MREAVAISRTPNGVTAWFSDLLRNQVLMAFGMSTALLSVLKWGAAGVALFSVLVCFYTFMERKALAKNPNIRVLGIFLAFGFISAFWSGAPRATMYYGVQILLTCLGGFLIASSRRPYDSLKGIALAFILHTIISHLFGKFVPWENGQFVFVGVDGAKNYYGGVSGLTVLLSMGLAFASIDRNHRWIAAMAFVGIVLGGLGLIRSLAMGFTLSTFVCGIIIIYLNIYRALSNRLRFGLMLYVIYAIVCSAVVLFLVRDSILTIILTITHKDMTLTGRTGIWDVANESIKHHYWLGSGQSAFWVPGNPYAEKIWEANHIITKKGFSLHNTYLDLWATVGLVGLILYTMCVASLFFLQAKTLSREPSTTQIVWFGVFLFFLFLSAVENFAPIAMNFTTFVFAIGQTYRFNPPASVNVTSESNRSRLTARRRPIATAENVDVGHG